MLFFLSLLSFNHGLITPSRLPQSSIICACVFPDVSPTLISPECLQVWIFSTDLKLESDNKGADGRCDINLYGAGLSALVQLLMRTWIKRSLINKMLWFSYEREAFISSNEEEQKKPRTDAKFWPQHHSDGNSSSWLVSVDESVCRWRVVLQALYSSKVLMYKKGISSRHKWAQNESGLMDIS